MEEEYEKQKKEIEQQQRTLEELTSYKSKSSTTILTPGRKEPGTPKRTPLRLGL